VSPIDAISSVEFAATGSASTRWFHAFDAGKIVQRGADGSRDAFAAEPASSSAPAATSSELRSGLKVLTTRPPGA